jgi:hypothetical protein
MYKITSQSEDFITYCDKDKCISIPVELVNQIKDEGRDEQIDLQRSMKLIRDNLK